MKDYECPLSWGLSFEKFKKLFQQLNLDEAWINKNHVDVDVYTWLEGNNFDCGALILHGANYVTSEILNNVHIIASKNGFSKIFATVVGYKKEPIAQVFLDDPRWQLVVKGKSNRSNGNYDEWVFVYYNPDCEFKGHYGH